MPDQVTSLPAVASLVPIEPGKPHGHTVLDTDGVRFVVLGFAAGAALTEHRTPKNPLLMQALAGEVTVTVAGQDTVLRPGDFLHLDAGVLHAVRADVDSHLGLLLLNSAG
ncbi:cupin domain-containing protein [Sporichthya sp.]|uniref:cupin domain-containing protein n=1 Tax=Sporichthya sp. TaxID=65475 RepID=UPI001839F300|nr:cupin domain-containing protein [Sporichthya sp.]MBA3742791.1 cupin domain-containing protein [Sporichthya sp.]